MVDMMSTSLTLLGLPDQQGLPRGHPHPTPPRRASVTWCRLGVVHATEVRWSDRDSGGLGPLSTTSAGMVRFPLSGDDRDEWGSSLMVWSAPVERMVPMSSVW